MELASRFDLKQIESILLVADERHFGNAAKRAFVSTATVSGRVKDFERSVGFTVFDRTSRSVELTAAGSELVPQLREAMAGLRVALLNASRREESSIDVNMAIASDTDRSAVLAAVNRMRSSYRSVRTERVNDHQIPDLLASGNVQLALSWSTIEAMGGRPAGLLSRVLMEQEVLAVVNREDHLAAQGSLTSEDLVGRPIVLFHREIAPTPHDTIMGFLRQSGHEPQLVSPQHSQASMAEALGWTKDAVTFGSSANLSLLPEHRVAIPLDVRLSTPVMAHAPVEHAGLLDSLVRFVDEFDSDERRPSGE